MSASVFDFFTLWCKLSQGHFVLSLPRSWISHFSKASVSFEWSLVCRHQNPVTQGAHCYCFHMCTRIYNDFYICVCVFLKIPEIRPMLLILIQDLRTLPSLSSFQGLNFFRQCTVLHLFYVLAFRSWGQGPQLPDQESNLHPLHGGFNLNLWTTREAPLFNILKRLSPFYVAIKCWYF